MIKTMLGNRWGRALTLAAVVCCAVPAQAAPNLVSNGGFESGYTGWAQTGNTTYDFVGPDKPRTGSSSAFFGASCGVNPAPGCVSTSGITQTLTTADRHIYAFEFYLLDLGSGSGNFLAQLLADGVSLVRQDLGLNNQDYLKFSGEFIGTGDDTVLSFVFGHDSTWWSLDDVSVTDTGRLAPLNSAPEPAGILLLGLALAAAGLATRRQRP